MAPRAEAAADKIAAEAQRVGPGVRVGTRADLRDMCGVSVGTLHEALRILQARGEIVVRSGPGGGVFAAQQTALSMLLQRVRSQALIEPDFIQAARVLNALAPLVITDAITALDDTGERRLQRSIEALDEARGEHLGEFVRTSLEVFATLVLLTDRSVVGVIAGSVIQIQISALPGLGGPIDPDWRSVVDDHAAAVARMITAVCERDPVAALHACRDRRFMGLYAGLASQGHG